MPIPLRMGEHLGRLLLLTLRSAYPSFTLSSRLEALKERLATLVAMSTLSRLHVDAKILTDSTRTFFYVATQICQQFVLRAPSGTIGHIHEPERCQCRDIENSGVAVGGFTAAVPSR